MNTSDDLFKGNLARALKEDVGIPDNPSAGRYTFTYLSRAKKLSTHTVCTGVRRAPVYDALHGEDDLKLVMAKGVPGYMQAGALMFRDGFGLIPCSCTCEDFHWRGTRECVPKLPVAYGGCKHMYAVAKFLKQ
jgi:hypothetical protein